MVSRERLTLMRDIRGLVSLRRRCQVDLDAYFTMGQASFLLCVSRETIRNLIRSDELTGEREYGGPGNRPDSFQWRIYGREISDYANRTRCGGKAGEQG